MFDKRPGADVYNNIIDMKCFMLCVIILYATNKTKMKERQKMDILTKQIAVIIQGTSITIA